MSGKGPGINSDHYRPSLGVGAVCYGTSSERLPASRRRSSGTSAPAANYSLCQPSIDMGENILRIHVIGGL